MLGDEGISAIIQALNSGINITKLGVAANDIGPAALQSSLPKFYTSQTISCSYCIILCVVFA